jgi:tetratricopeptide (TPR) repeat protein
LQAHGTALGNLGVIRVDQGHAAEAVELLTRSMQIYQDLGNEAGQAVLYGTLGLAYRMLGDLGKARQHLLTAVELNTRHAAQGTLIMSAAHLGDTCRLLGDTEKAATHLHEAMRLAQKLGRPLGQAVAGYYLAALHMQLGDHDTARLLAMQALDTAEQAKDNSTVAYALNTLGFIHLQTHQFDLSESCYRKAFHRTQSGGEPHPRIQAIIGLAHNAMHRNQLHRAGELISTALSQSRAFKFRLCEAEAHAADAALNCARQALESAHAPP